MQSDRLKLLHEKVTADSEIPPLPRKAELLPKPDIHLQEALLKALDAKLASHEQQLDAVKTALKEARQACDGRDAAGLEGSGAYEELVEKKDRAMENYAELSEEGKGIIEEQRRIRKELSAAYCDEGEEDEENIRQLDEEYEQREREIEENENRRKELAKVLEDLYQKLSELRLYPQNLQKNAESDQVLTLNSQRETLKHSIEELKAKRKTLLTVFKEKEHQYKDQQKLIKAIEQANYTQKKLREADEKKKAQKQREEEQARTSSYMKDITTCEGVIRFLERAAAPSEAKPAKSDDDPEKTPPLTPVEAGMELVLDKKLREAQEGLNWFRSVQSKSKKKRGRRPATEQLNLSLPVDMLAFLAAQNIKIPNNTSEVADTISALRAWRTDIDSSAAVLKSPKKFEHATEDTQVVEEFPSLRGTEGMRMRAFTEESATLEDRKERPHRGGRRGKRGKTYRHGREGRKGSEVSMEDHAELA